MAVCAFGKISLKGLFPARWSFGTELYARLSYFASGHTQTLFVAMDTSCTQPRETDRFRAMGYDIPDERIIQVGAAIGTHIGINAIGFVYIAKE